MPRNKRGLKSPGNPCKLCFYFLRCMPGISVRYAMQSLPRITSCSNYFQKCTIVFSLYGVPCISLSLPRLAPQIKSSSRAAHNQRSDGQVGSPSGAARAGSFLKPVSGIARLHREVSRYRVDSYTDRPPLLVFFTLFIGTTRECFR
jgi:hypothetical protein